MSSGSLNDWTGSAERMDDYDGIWSSGVNMQVYDRQVKEMSWMRTSLEDKSRLCAG